MEEERIHSFHFQTKSRTSLYPVINLFSICYPDRVSGSLERQTTTKKCQLRIRTITVVSYNVYRSR